MSSLLDDRAERMLEAMLRVAGGAVFPLEHGRAARLLLLAAQRVEVMRSLYDPDQERDERGRWTDEGGLSTSSPEFKSWFGDSKVVDDKGQPKLVFHRGSFREEDEIALEIGPEGMHFGTRSAADERPVGKEIDDLIKSIELEQDEETGKWHWSMDGLDSYDIDEEGFDSKEDARDDAEQKAVDMGENAEWDERDVPMTEAYLSIKNPMRIRDQIGNWKQAVAQAKRLGHDGIIYTNQFEDKGSTSYIVFEPTQVKSRRSKGFDPKNPLVTAGFNPDQPRDESGRWTDSSETNVSDDKAETDRQQSLASAQTNPLAHPDFVIGGSSNPDVTRYVAAYGQEFKPSKLPPDVERGTPRECYKNASLLVMQRPDLTYAEGFARNKATGELTFQHAWAVDHEGNVVDPTWDNPEESQYFGVKYDRAAYLKYLYKAKIYGVLGSTDKNVRRAVMTGGAGLRTLGGPGSGNFGHSGRPGEVGGSSSEDFRSFERQALENLQQTSRTVKGVSDTSSSPEKPKLTREGKPLEVKTIENFRAALKIVWNEKDRKFSSAEDVRVFADKIASTVSSDLLQPGQGLYRTWETPSNMKPDKIKDAYREMTTSLYEKLKEKEDPITTAAWLEKRISVVHPWADGGGRTSKLLSAFVLTRGGKALPEYPNALEYYKRIAEPGWEKTFRSWVSKRERS